MLPFSAERETNTGESLPPFVRLRPERPLLQQLIEKYYPTSEVQCAAEDRMLQDYVQREFEDYLKTDRFGTWFPACTQ